MTSSPPTPKGLVATAGSTLLRKLPSCVLLLIIFLAPTQLGLHFWPSSALLYGIRIDYLSPTIYFLDLLLLLYLALTPARNEKKAWKQELLILTLLTNLIFSVNPLATLSWSLHLLLYLSFVRRVIPRTHNFVLTRALTWALIFQVGLAALQTLGGKSLGGALYYLGERTLNLSLPNVAKSEFLGELILRPYGTFSHPNTLAGWLVVAFLIVRHLTKNNKVRVLALLAAATGVIISGSRSAALVLFGLVVPLYFFKNIKTRLIYFLLIVLSSFFFVHGFATRDLELSLGERLALERTSLQVIGAFPLFGTGASSSLSVYPRVSATRLFQPDHNSITLIISWFGLAGVLVAFYVLRPHLKPLYPLLPLILLDHYFLTSPQGLLILLLYLRVTMSYAT